MDSWPVVQKSWRWSSWGSQPMGDARRQRIRPDVISGIVATGILLNIDMRNTFNSLRRESFLSVARVRPPGLYSLLWQAYSSQTRSFFSEEEFASETGIQQWTPIEPAFFVLSVDEGARGVQSELNVWYFLTIWWCYPERVHDDLVVLLERLKAIGLQVNGNKYELCNNAMRSVFSQPVSRGFRGSGRRAPPNPSYSWGYFIMHPLPWGSI